jgi:K(+)-stimulated pyrophosphate-energized sodium pump
VGIAKIDGIDIYRADVLAGLFVGGMIPFIFSALAIRAVGEAAMAMVEEVRRQFRTIPGIMEGKGKPEYEKCVAISTDASIKKMMLPGAIALLSPVIIGFIFGPQVLGGFLAGATVSGVLMGIFQNNAGGAWDNAKKSFEKGALINNETHFKGSEAHKASVTGDTVGDPFKDTSGPSMNILIKLMSIVSLVIAPTLAHNFRTKINADRKLKIENLIKLDQTTLREESFNKDKWALVKTLGQQVDAKEVQSFIGELDKDNLITQNSFSIAVAKGELYIDGTKQPSPIQQKYSDYIQKTGDFISKEAPHK